MVRWSLRCFPRILDNVMGTMVNLDGLSEYHFNDAGFVQMHKVTSLRKHVVNPSPQRLSRGCAALTWRVCCKTYDPLG